MQSNEGGLTNNYACLPNFCERMKPCNLNSECIYSKENNTFFCRCLNGAPTCDEFSSTENVVNTESNENSIVKTLNDRNDLSTDISASSSSAFSSSSSAEVTTSISEKSDDDDDSSTSLTIEDGLDAKTAQAENKPQLDIPKLGFNLDNVNKLTIFNYSFVKKKC
jgi:hypothetical protein